MIQAGKSIGLAVGLISAWESDLTPTKTIESLNSAPTRDLKSTLINPVMPS
jgi:hypothetical protein